MLQPHQQYAYSNYACQFKAGTSSMASSADSTRFLELYSWQLSTVAQCWLSVCPQPRHSSAPPPTAAYWVFVFWLPECYTWNDPIWASWVWVRMCGVGEQLEICQCSPAGVQYDCAVTIWVMGHWILSRLVAYKAFDYPYKYNGCCPD